MPFVAAPPDRISFAAVQEGGPFVKPVPLSVDAFPLILSTGSGGEGGGGQCANEPWSPDVGALSQTNGDDNDRDRSVCEPA